MKGYFDGQSLSIKIYNPLDQGSIENISLFKSNMRVQDLQ